MGNTDNLVTLNKHNMSMGTLNGLEVGISTNCKIFCPLYNKEGGITCQYQHISKSTYILS